MKPRFTLRNLIVGAAVSAVLLLALSAFSAYKVVRRAVDLAWVEHSHAVLDQLEEARLQIKAAELARQDFLASGKVEPRERVRRAAAAVRSSAEALQKLTADDPARAARAEELATLAAALRASVETRAHRGSPLEGAPAFKRADALARDMEVEERTLLGDRVHREQRTSDSALAALGAEVLLALLLAAAELRLIVRGLDERERLMRESEPPRT